MAEIQIIEKEKRDDTALFEVHILEDRDETIHQVGLKDLDWSRLTGGTMDRVGLVKKSFEFLLQREPKESILEEFDLMQINNYFPEYEGEMKVTL